MNLPLHQPAPGALDLRTDRSGEPSGRPVDEPVPAGRDYDPLDADALPPCPSPEQSQFAASVHALLEDADTPAAARRWAEGEHGAGLALWRGLADLGVCALAVPARFGGLAAGPLDVIVACEELGHHLLPGPVAETVAAVPTVLAGLAAATSAAAAPATPEAPGVRATRAPADGSAQRPEDDRIGGWLTALAEGRCLATLAAPPAVPLAVDPDAAGMLLLVDPDGRVHPARVAPGSGRRSVDPSRRLAELQPDGPPLTGTAAPAVVAMAVELGTLACAAQLLGAGRALLEASVRHAVQRSQFGRPIGSFQAVKHQLADVLLGLEFARPLLHAAARALESGAPTAARDVSAAKVACGDAAQRAARTALQVHGALGYTLEHDVGLFLTRVRALLPLWGTRAAHRARVLAAITATAG